jgi:integrase
MWRRVKIKADLQDLHFHDLRAKSVMDAKRENGRDFAQALAGHASGDMTDAYMRDNPYVDPLK